MSVLLGTTTSGLTAALGGLFTPYSAVSFLLFTLLYTPCVAAIASVRRELGGRWAFGVALGQCAIAWVAAGAVQLFGMLLGVA